MRFQPALNKTFCRISAFITHQQLKQHHKTKINKIIISGSSSSPSLFTQSSQYHNWKTNKDSILMIMELGRSMWKSSTKNSKFYARTDFEHKFYKVEIENWLPIGFERGFPWLITRSYNHWSGVPSIGSPPNWEPSLELIIGAGLKFYTPIHKVLEKPWRHFTSETVQVFSNSTTITHTSITKFLGVKKLVRYYFKFE